MECWIPREYNYVKTRDNKRNPCHILQPSPVKKEMPWIFLSPSRKSRISSYLVFSLTHSLNFIIIILFPSSLFRFERIETPCMYPNLITLPPPPSLVLSIPRFVCHFTRPPDKLPSPKNRFAAGRRSFKRPIPIIIICLISDKRWTNVYPILYIYPLFLTLKRSSFFFF